MKKIICSFVAFMCMAALASVSNAQTQGNPIIVVDKIAYIINLENKTANVYGGGLTEIFHEPIGNIEGVDYSGDVIIPNEVEYEGDKYPVTQVTGFREANAQRGVEEMTSISIPSSVILISGITGLEELKSINIAGCEILTGVSNLDISSIILPENLREANGANSTFQSLSGLPRIKSISFPESFVTGNYMLNKCNSLATIELASAQDLDNSCNDLPKLETIEFNNIKNLSNSFSNCPSLKQITFPDHEVSLTNSFTSGTVAIQLIINRCEVPYDFDTQSFSGIKQPENITLVVPDGSVEAYKSNESWKRFGNIIDMTTYSAFAATINVKECRVSGLNGAIEIYSPKLAEVRIYSISGNLVWRKKDVSNEIVSLPKGIYMVKINERAEKVMVK